MKTLTDGRRMPSDGNTSHLDGSYNDLMVTVLGLVVYLLQVTKSLTTGILFREVNAQSKNDVQLIFKSESVHK
jgi:hypothetical protein